MSIYQTLVDFYGYYMGPDFDSFFSFSFLSFSSFSLSMSLSCFIFLDDQYKIGMLIIKRRIAKDFSCPHALGELSERIKRMADAIPSIIGSTASSGPLVTSMYANWNPQERARALATKTSDLILIDCWQYHNLYRKLVAHLKWGYLIELVVLEKIKFVTPQKNLWLKARRLMLQISISGFAFEIFQPISQLHFHLLI
ncbi:Uncharacterised protein [Klebsiella pneumoniae]|nr:Uncharacterised protein [Klebsiella pneumoniae]